MRKMNGSDGAAADLDDIALLGLYAAGDPGAARLMAQRFLPVAFRLAVRMLGERSEAEDVAQDAMIRLFAAAPGWRNEGARVTTWLYKVTANLATDRLRRRTVLPIEVAGDVVDGAGRPEDILLEKARARALEAALARLPERQRLAVILRHIEGLSNPEIAEAMDLGIEAVESLVARGKRALATDLGRKRSALGYEHDGR